MNQLVNNPVFGVAISIAAFEFGQFIYRKTKFSIFNPLLISQIIIVVFLLKFNISYSSYNAGGQLISFFLSPATVILAVPLYKKLKLLRENAAAVIIGITLGSIVGIVSVVVLSKLFNVDIIIRNSLVPKSVTTPIGVEISSYIGGVPAITVAVIIITGIIGSVIAPFVCRVFKIIDKLAVGTAIGTSSHAIGTTKALELGETEGAMSSLSIGIAGLITVILAPILLNIVDKII